MTTSPFDPSAHPREGDGKFATKPAAEATDVTLDEIEPPAYGPGEDGHNISYAVQRAAESYHAMCTFSDRVSEVIGEDLWMDMEAGDEERMRYLDIRVEESWGEYNTELTLRDADGEQIARTNRSGWETWYAGVGADYAVPDVPADFHAPAGTLGKDEHDLARVVVDLHQLRDYDWKKREQQMRDEIALAFAP